MDRDTQIVDTRRALATVSNIDDDENLFRFKVTCPRLMADNDTEVPFAVVPELGWGEFSVPDVGDVVVVYYVFSSENDEICGQSAITSPDLTWRGQIIYGENDDKGLNIPSAFTEKNYGKRRGYQTKAGHRLLFDDTDGEEELHIVWGNTTLETSIKITEDSLVIEDHKENQIELLASGTINVTANSGINLNSAGDADDFLVRGNDLIAYISNFVNTFNAHLHPTAMGPSAQPVPNPAFPTLTVPVVVPVPLDFLSSTAKVK